MITSDQQTQMVTQEPHDLPAQLQRGQIRVQIQPIHAFDLERHVTLEHELDRVDHD